MTDEPITEGVFTAPPIVWPLDPDAYGVAASHQQCGLWRMNPWRLEDVVHWSTWGYTNPDVVRCVWRAVEALGFEQGRVLECGGGAGAFTAMAPPGASMTRVELLSPNAARAEALYPDADVRWEWFSESVFPDGHFDVVVGNLSWGSTWFWNADRRQLCCLHERFLLKALEVTRPGGIVAVAIAGSFLDQEDQGVREMIMELADLLGAVRLPDGIHTRFAHTYSGMDVLILRRRELGADPISSTWETVKSIRIDGHTMQINKYFLERPEHILGRLGVSVSSYGTPQWMEVRGDLRDTPGQLRYALAEIVRAAGARQPAPHHALWDSYRRALCALGDTWAAELLRAVAAAHDDDGSDKPSLERLRHEAVWDLARLDLDSAHRAWDLDCARRTAVEQGGEAQARVAEALAASERKVGRDRENEEVHVRTWIYHVERNARAAARAVEALGHLHGEGRHPKQWWEPFGLRVARWVAREQEIARTDIAIAQE